MPFEKDPNEIGVLWTKRGAKGEYMTGEINGVKVVMFPITSTNAKAPNWRVLKATPREDAPTRAPFNANARPITDEDVPF